jgi:hypothetical protein
MGFSKGYAKPTRCAGKGAVVRNWMNTVEPTESLILEVDSPPRMENGSPEHYPSPSNGPWRAAVDIQNRVLSGGGEEERRRLILGMSQAWRRNHC